MRPLLAVALVAAFGCGGEDDYIVERAQEVRELELLADVEVVSMSREEFAAQAAQQAAQITDAELTEYAETYGRLGFFDIDLDLRPIIAGSSSDFVGATYWEGQITLVGVTPDDTILHEWVHALQDQHFVLTELDDYETSDGFLARRATVEGDAVLAQWRFIMEDEYDLGLRQVNWMESLPYLRQRSDDYVVDSPYPSVFADYVSFVYSYGLEFVAHDLTGVRLDDLAALRAGPYDYDDYDRLFTTEPANTTQEVLALGDPDPVRVGSALIVPAADRYDLVDMDRLGQWYCHLLFFNASRDPVASRALARPWDGDIAVFVKQVETSRHGFVWLSAWDDPDAAQAVADTMWTIYGRAIDATFEPERFAVADDGEPVWIEAQGDRLVVIKNIARDDLAEFASTAFALQPTQKRLVRTRPSLAELLHSLHE